MIYKEKSKLCLSFFGITIASGLIQLFRYRDNGIINNGKSPARIEQERQTDERPSVLEKLRSYSTQERTEAPKKSAPSRGAEREI